MSSKSYNLDVYIGNVAGGRNALLRILGPLIGLVKNGRGVNREVITNGNDAADDKMVLEFKTLMDSISPAYFTWTNG
uniref:Uncharacterized protein n=1 Tax=Panagrolaimus superbus TaxID=310955 RepID=A0A914ZGW7_9BILA